MTTENNAKSAEIELHLRSDRKHVATPDFGNDFHEQMLRVKDSETEDLMRQAFEGTPEGDELGFGFTGQVDSPEVIKAGMLPEPDGISTAQAVGQILIGGPTDAFKNIATNVTQMGDEVRGYEVGGKTIQSHLEEADQFFGTDNFFGDIGAGGLLSGRVDVPIGEFKKEGGGGVQALRGLVAYLTALSVLRGAGAKTLPASAGADAFGVDNETNLSNLFNELVPEDSPFRNPITDFMAAKTTDSEFVKGMKGAAEGLGIALPIELLAKGARVISGMRTGSDGGAGLADDLGQVKAEKTTGAKAQSPLSASFDGADYDIGMMELPFEKVNNDAFIKKVSSELDAIRKKNTNAAGETKLNKKGRKVRHTAEVVKTAREQFLKNPEGETKRLLELDPSKKLDAVDEIEFALVQESSLQRIDDLVKAGDEVSGNQAFEHFFNFHLPVIEEQAARFSESAGRDLVFRKALKQGDFSTGRRLQSVSQQVLAKSDPNIDPLAFAQKWRETSPKELIKETRRLGGADMIFEAWVNSLFGLKTHVVNTLGNVVNLTMQTVERGVAAQIRRTKRAFGGSANGVTEGEAMDMLYGMVTSQVHNLATLGKNLSRVATLKEIPGSQFQKLEQANVRAIKGANTNFKEGSFMYQGVDAAGHIMSAQGKLLLTMDEYFKMTGYTAAVRAAARRTAVGEGKTGRALTERIGQLVKEPSPSIKAEAQNFADYATFTKELGQSGKAMHEFVHKTPFGRYVVPFHNVLVNLAKFSGERTPLAVFSKQIRADLAAGGVRADLAQARMATGTAASMGFLTLALGGGITGGGPTNKKMREAWRRKGNQPYSFVISGKDGKQRHVSFERAEPAAFFAGIMADFVEIADQISEGERIAFAKGFALSMSKHFLSQTFAGSVGDFFNGFLRGDARFFENLGASVVPFGGVMRDVEKVVDPTLRDTKTVDPTFLRRDFRKQFGKEFGDSLADSAEVLSKMLNKIKANIPGYSKDLPARVNMWGEVVAYERAVGFDPLSPFFIQTVKDSPLDDWLIELKVPVGLPEPVISDAKITGSSEHPVALTPQQYHDYVVLSGKPAFEELDKYVRTQEFKNRADGAKAAYLEAKIRMYRELAVRQLTNLKNKDGSFKYPDLRMLFSDEVIRARAELANQKQQKVTLTPGK